MAARWYCVQAAHSVKGWIDFPSLASRKKSEADACAKQFAQERGAVTRVIRKPHGWMPMDDPALVLAPQLVGLLKQDSEAARDFKASEDKSLAASRKHEKARRRQPKTWYARILRGDLV